MYNYTTKLLDSLRTHACSEVLEQCKQQVRPCLRCRDEGCTTAAFDRAAMNNHVEVIMWLVNNRSEGGTEKALQWAVGRGHKQVLIVPCVHIMPCF